jgi:outer membrane protein TolC
MSISKIVGVFITFIWLFAPVAGAQSPTLSLDEAVRIAVTREDPSLQRFEARALAKEELAVADAQLSDPKISATAQNFPVDTLSFGQEPMTQVRFGVRQDLPRGQSLRIRREKRQAEASAERVKRDAQLLDIALQVRIAWLTRYRAEQELRLTEEARVAVNDLIDALGASFAQGKLTSSDVLRAELELALLDDQIVALEQVRDWAANDLERFIGEASDRPSPVSLPAMPMPASVERMEAALVQHAKVQAIDAGIQIERSSIELAEEAFKPAWSLDGGYGFRGGGRPDFVSVGVTLSVPLFTGNRQDRRLSAARHTRAARELDRASLLLDLRRDLYRTYDDWLKYDTRIELYDRSVIVRAAETAEASINAYAGGLADFPELIRSQLAELSAETQRLELTVEQAKAHAILTYLYGEPS